MTRISSAAEHPNFEEGQRLDQLVRDYLGTQVPDPYTRSVTLSPAYTKAVYHSFKNLSQRSVVAGKLFDAIGVLAGRELGCDYLVHNHARALKRLLGEDGQQRPAAEQESVEDLTAGLEESRIFSSRERAALAFARRLVSAPESIDDDAFEALRELGYTDSQIMEILATAGMFVMHATVISALALKSPFDPQN